MLERIVDVAGGEHEQLGVEPLERLLQLFLRLHLRRRPRPSRRARRRRHRGARCARRPPNRPQSGSAGCVAARIASSVVVGEKRLRSVGLGLPRLLRTGHGDDQRDPVALGDGLAQTSGAGHATATLPIVATSSACACAWRSSFSSRRCPPSRCAAARPPILGTARADFLAGTRRLRPDRRACRRRPDLRRVRRRHRPDLVRAGARRRRRRRPRPGRRRLRGREHAASTATGRRTPTASTSRRSSRTPHTVGDHHGRALPERPEPHAAAPRASPSRPRRTAGGRGARGSSRG